MDKRREMIDIKSDSLRKSSQTITDNNDGNKSDNKTEDKKEAARKSNIERVKEYNEKNYAFTNICTSPEDKVKLIIQAKMAGLSLSQYVMKLVNEDKVNFDSIQYQALYEKNIKKIQEGKKGEKKISDIFNEESQKEKEIEREELIKEAQEYFGQDPFTLKKSDRAQFIIQKVGNDNSKGQIWEYCRILGISRECYYQNVRKVKDK